MAGFYDADGHFLRIGLVQRGVQVGVAEYFVEVVNRKVIFRAFVFQDIDPFENPGDVLFDDQVRGLLDDDQVYFQRLCVKLVFA
jgi:hypothetical protein